MNLARGALRLTAWVSISAGVLLIALALAWPSVRPRLAGWASEKLGDTLGAAVSVRDAEPRLDGRIELFDLQVVQPGRSLTCDRMQVALDLRTTIRDRVPAIRSVSAQACRASLSAEEDTPNAEESDDPELVASPERAIALLTELHARVPRLDVESLIVERQQDRVTFADVHTWPRGDRHHFTADIAATARGIDISGPIELVATDGRIDWTQVPQLHHRGWAIEIDELGWEAGLVEVGALTVAGPDGSVTAAHVEVSGTRNAPRVVSSRIRATTQHEAPTRAAEANDTAPLSSGERAVERLLELATRSHALRNDLRARPLAPIDLDLTDLRVTFGSREARIPRLSLVDGRYLEGSLGVEDVAVDFVTDLRVLEQVRFSADGLDLAPLGEGLGPDRGVEGRVEARGVLEWTETGGLHFAGSVDVFDAGFVHDMVSPERVEDLGVESQVETWIEPTSDRPIAMELIAQTGDVPLDFELRIDRQAADEDDEEEDGTPRLRPWYELSLEGGVSQETECEAMWQAVPAGMIPNLGHGGASFQGEAQPRIEFEYTFGAPRTFSLRPDGFPGTCKIEIEDPLFDPEELLDDSYVNRVEADVVSEEEVIYVGPGTADWVDIDDLPTFIPALMYLSEEIDFYQNPGIDIGLINRAARVNIEGGRYVYGGSSVTQQLVKNLYLSRAKTLSRKLEEALIVWAMETRLSKDRILELYINCIEFGPDIWGIVRAADYYFGVQPDELTPLQAAFLAAIKPDPSIGEGYQRRGYSRETGWLVERMQVLLQRLVDYGGHISQEEADYYHPYVVFFPTSERADESPVGTIERPDVKGEPIQREEPAFEPRLGDGPVFELPPSLRDP